MKQNRYKPEPLDLEADCVAGFLVLAIAFEIVLFAGLILAWVKL
jgi:hypothetical protein